MRTYGTGQETLLKALWWPKWKGNPKKRRYMYICMADSLFCIAKSNTTLQSNYTPIKINLKNNDCPRLSEGQIESWNRKENGNKRSSQVDGQSALLLKEPKKKKGGHVQSKHSIISDYSNICSGGKGLSKSSKQVLAKAETQEREEKKLTWKKKACLQT